MKYPIRTEIEVLSADKPIYTGFYNCIEINSRGKMKKWRGIGFIMTETIGFGIINTKGLSKLDISTK